MDCPGCGRTNRTGAKFCAGCATPLIPACAACGRQLALDAAFCDECGTPVGGSTTPPVSTEAVRKTVTVVFCDLVGSTPFGERVDTESVRETLGRYHSMVQRAVDDHGGTVAKFIGDGVMAVFGVPEVAVDDAERAVLTGLELQRGFTAIQSVVRDRFGADLGLRVGINTGEVIVSDDDSDLVGDVVNTAARLEAACEPGQVWAGEHTWRLTRSTIRFESLGDTELKGKSEGVATYRAIDEFARPDDATAPFVGRQKELTALLAVIDDAVTNREVRVATVIGAPGVGKTRLADELERSYDGDATFVDIRIERTGGTTFAPVAELLRIAASLDEARTGDEVRARIGALVADLDDADRVASLLASFVGASEPRSTEELFFAVRRLLEAVGQTRSIVVVVDDVQWAEPLMLDLLEHVAEWVHDAPAVVLALARPELREIRPTLAEKGRRVAEAIALEGLDAAATAELAARLVGAAALPDDLLARLPDSTEGNPLFVRELMKMLVDDKVIVEGEQGWELTIDAEAVEVPPTIQSLLSSRIERLPGTERRLLERASVVGADFPLGAVAALTPQGDAGRLIPILERLRRKELLEPTGSYWGNEPVFRFHHALIRDAAYRRLLKRARADLHLRVADWMEAAASASSREREVAIGYHLGQAHDLRVQLNITDEETATIGARAADTLGAAAHRALGRDDVAAASSLAARAVALLDGESTDLPELLILGCEAFLALGDVGATHPLLEQLENRSGGDERLSAWGRAFRAQLRVLTEPNRLVEAEATAASAAEALARLDDRTGEANARLIRAGALARLGHIGECEAELDRALTAARAADDGRRVATVLGAAPVAALWGPSPVPRAGGRCLDVLRLLRITTGSPRVEAVATRCQAVLEALRGRFDTARKMLADAHDTVEELGDRHGLMETELYWGLVELLAGDPEAAEPHLRAAYGGLGRLGIGADAGQAAAHLSRALLLQGRLDEAADLAADSEALAGQNPQTAISAKAARAELLAAQGRLDEALRVAEEAVARAEGTDILVDHAQANLALARVRSLAGDAEGTRSALAAAQNLFTAKGASITIDVEIPGPSVGTPSGEPSASSAGHPHDGVGTDEFRNRADDLVRAHLVDVARGDWDAARRLLADDVVLDDRRPMVSRTHRRADRSQSSHDGKSADPVADTDHKPWNEADRLMRLGMEHFGRDHDVWRALWDPDVEYHDRRSMVRDVHRGLQDIEKAFPLGFLVVREVETLAARGHGLVLSRTRMEATANVRSSWSDVPWEFLALTRLGRDGRMDRLYFFDLDDLDPALALLDELHEQEAVDPTALLALRSWTQGLGLTSDAAPERMFSFQDPDTRVVDRRATGRPVDDVNGFRERLSSLSDIPGGFRYIVNRLLASDGPISLVETTFRFRPPNGAEHESRSLFVCEISPESGLVRQAHEFGSTDVESARALFSQLSKARAERVDLSNTASMLCARAHVWSHSGDVDLLGPHLAATVDLSEPDGSTSRLEHTEVLDAIRAGRHGFGAEHRRVLAVRGERLALMEWAERHDSRAPDRRFAVVELDARARISDVRSFTWDVESLTDATDHLEARWKEIADLDEADVLVMDAIAGWRHGDQELLQRILHPDFLAADHRRFSWGDYDKEQFIALFDGEARNVVVEIPAIYLGRSGSGRAFQLTAWGCSEDEMIEALHGHFVGIVRDSKVLRCDGYDIDTPDETMARLRELQIELGDLDGEPADPDDPAP